MEHHHRSNLITSSQAHSYHIFHLVEDFVLPKQANVVVTMQTSAVVSRANSGLKESLGLTVSQRRIKANIII
jgi:hypothetical protein